MAEWVAAERIQRATRMMLAVRYCKLNKWCHIDPHANNRKAKASPMYSGIQDIANT